MNRLFFACIVASCTLLAEAQTMIKEMDDANTRFIPGNYMKNGEAAIYFSSDEYGYSDGATNYEAQIFDFELKPLKSFSFQIFHPYTIFEERISTGNIIKTKVITEERNFIAGMPPVAEMEARKTAFIRMIFDDNRYFDPSITLESLTSNCRVEGTTIYISLPISSNEGSRRFAEYLKTVETYLDASDMWGYAYTYSIQVPRCDGEWTTRTWYDVPVSNFYTPRCNDVRNANHWNGGVYLPFSQTFFNDDEKFEYVRFKATRAEGTGYGPMDPASPDGGPDPKEYLFGITASDRDGDGEEDFRSTYFGVHCSGIEVVSEDGDVIYTFPIPDNCEGNASIEFFKSDKSILAQAQFDWHNDKNEQMHTIRFYRLDKTSGIATVIRDENRLVAYPNPTPHGTPVEMELPYENGRTRLITVTSLGGAQVYSRSVAPGVSKVSIPTNVLAPGMYEFSLTVDGRMVETCKIIIR